MENDFAFGGGIQKQRLLPLEGALNVRELGGYPVAYNGRQGHVKWGLIFRSGALENMTAADIKIMESRKIKTLVDFRSADEKSASPEFSLSTAVKRVELPIDAGNLMGTLVSTSGSSGNRGEWLYNSDPEEAAAEMRKLYSALPEEAIPRYRELFALLSEPANAPVLFHCSAGKDRTGLASALILHALGAGEETIMEDYMASAEHLRRRYMPYADTKPYMVPYMTVYEDYLLAALKEIEKYGGPGGYIANELGADVKRLREIYTEH